MKDKITELASIAYQKTLQLIETDEHQCKIGSDYFLALEKEIFAELIIKEISTVKSELTTFNRTTVYGDAYEQGLDDMTETFLEHFGVK